jgi:PHD/YefM family antitoxin component YafN of YafNO toxin-antitoxin module
MGKRITASHLRQNIYRILDEVIETGRPVEIERKGTVVCIETERQQKNILETLTPHPGAIVGDPEDLVHMDWSPEWKRDLP